jgi:hypothetical protein
MDRTAFSVVASWLACIFAVVGAILIGVVSHGKDTSQGYLGGFSHENIFAWHPFLMTLGMICACVLALHSYAIIPLNHNLQKVVHVFFHTCALFCFAFGLNAIVKSHNGQNSSGSYSPNLNSMHSWVGLGALVLYAQNYLLGFAYFVTRNFKGAKEYLPTHMQLGLCALMLSTAAVVSGISEMKRCTYTVTSPDLNPASHYGEFTSACKKFQGGGVCVIFAAVLSMVALIPAKPAKDHKDGYPQASDLLNPINAKQ